MSRNRHAAVGLSVLVHQAFGFLWYAVVFHDLWFPGLGPTAAQTDPANPMPFVVDIIGWIVLSYALLWVIERSDATSWSSGARVGAIVGAALVAPPLAAHYAFIGITALSTALDAANVTVAVMLSGAILGGTSPARRPAAIPPVSRAP